MFIVHYASIDLITSRRAQGTTTGKRTKNNGPSKGAVEHT
jgi:hypothetical protein